MSRWDEIKRIGAAIRGVRSAEAPTPPPRVTCECERLRDAILAAAAILRMEANSPSGRDKTALLRAADDLEATARGEMR